MIRHIVMWNFKEGFSDEENRANATRVKAELEALKSFIDGIASLEVIIDALPSSNHDIVLNSLFTSVETLSAYQIHPEHVRVSQLVGNFVRNRACIDYEE